RSPHTGLAIVDNGTVVGDCSRQTVSPRRWSIVRVGTWIHDHFVAFEANVDVERIEVAGPRAVSPGAQEDEGASHPGGGPTGGSGDHSVPGGGTVARRCQAQPREYFGVR